MEKMTFLQEHICKDIEQIDGISVEQYQISGNTHWFHNAEGALNEIRYCPYCGERLLEN